MEKFKLIGKTIAELENFMIENGQSKFRARQVFNWIYLKSADCFDNMTDLPQSAREFLKEKAEITSVVIKEKQISKDSTMKFLFELSDGNCGIGE